MQFAGYEILGELARGGMGVVYRARDPRLGRDVAIKLLARTSEAAAIRFQREASALAKVRHANVVPVHTAGVEVGQPYLVMDLVEGDSLGDLLQRQGPLTEAAAVRHCLDLARALEHVHACGLLHRDVKPDNILLRDGHALLTDFGLVKATDDDGDALTRTGTFLGTPGFAAPEQAVAQKDELGPATDVFGLGATLFALVTGQPPFAGATLTELLARMQGDPPLASELRPKLSAGLDALCAGCLRADPADRYADMSALAEDLERLLAGERPSGSGSRRGGSPRGPGLLFAGVAASAVLALALLAVILTEDTAPAAHVGSSIPTPTPAKVVDPKLTRALKLLREGRRAAALDAFDALPSPPAEPVLEALLPEVEARLDGRRPEQALELLRRPAAEAALEGDALRAGRIALAQDAVTHAQALADEQDPTHRLANPSLLKHQATYLQIALALNVDATLPRPLLDAIITSAPLVAQSKPQSRVAFVHLISCAGELDPDDAYAHGQLGAAAVLFQSGELAPLIPLLRRAIHLNADYDLLKADLRTALRRAIRTATPQSPELTEMTRQLINDPTIRRAKRNQLRQDLVDELAQRGLFDEALDVVVEALQRTPGDPLWDMRRANLRWHRGEHEAAVADALRLLPVLDYEEEGTSYDDEKRQKHLVAGDRLLRILWNTRREEHLPTLSQEARRLLLGLRNENPLRQRPWHAVLAWTLIRQERVEEARSALKDALRAEGEIAQLMKSKDRSPSLDYPRLLERLEPDVTSVARVLADYANYSVRVRRQAGSVGSER